MASEKETRQLFLSLGHGWSWNGKGHPTPTFGRWVHPKNGFSCKAMPSCGPTRIRLRAGRQQTTSNASLLQFCSPGRIWFAKLFTLEMLIFQRNRSLGFLTVKEEDQTKNRAAQVCPGCCPRPRPPLPQDWVSPCVNTATAKKYFPLPTHRALGEDS